MAKRCIGKPRLVVGLPKSAWVLERVWCSGKTSIIRSYNIDCFSLEHVIRAAYNRRHPEHYRIVPV